MGLAERQDRSTPYLYRLTERGKEKLQIQTAFPDEAEVEVAEVLTWSPVPGSGSNSRPVHGAPSTPPERRARRR
jgi:hypothetical protein